MAKKVPKPHRNSSLIKGVSESPSAKVNEQKLEEDFLISFKYLDKNQGQSFDDWQQGGLLARAIEKLGNYCSNTLSCNLTNGLAVYGDFPQKSDFTHPKHVPEDAEWARIHITGTQIFAGFVNRNVFNVVFLDKDHRFYIVEKKHT